ncbi:MAG TPA: site-2 protease family protein [Polyangia bacterium]|nr:site-2 protease family protein [Polyangia bacterium]
MSADGAAISPHVCAGCGTQIAGALLACPSCGRLVHAAELKRLAAAAAAAEQAGDVTRALESWRPMLDLLPRESTQHARVLAKVQALSAAVTAGGGAAPARPRGSAKSKAAAGLGTIGVLLAKFKWGLLLLLGKGKALLVGLSQAKTMLSMAIAVGVYTSYYGWKFALGLILSIYVHEMGHVVALRRYGIPATAPMFIPGFGALVRLKQNPATVGEDARTGLAGPIWGTGAALAALALGAAFHNPLLFAIARLGAWINLFNLLPIWQLDGGRGFAALSRRQRGTVAAVLLAAALVHFESLLFVVALVAGVRAASGKAPSEGDRPVLVTYLALALGLSALAAVAQAGAGDLPLRPFVS